MDSTRFDNYQDVNLCNHCEHYYTSACDGKCKKLSEESSENAQDNFCNAFIPTRKDFILDKITGIKGRIRLLESIIIALVLVHLLEILL